MENIVPRWEWRTFGQDFGNAEKHFATLHAERVQSSEEIYLLAAGSNANVKIRDGLLDIKILERVDANGLEQWRPAIKRPSRLTDSVFRRPCPRSACRMPAQRASAFRSIKCSNRLPHRRPHPDRERFQDSCPIPRRRLRFRAHRRRRQWKESANRRNRGCRRRQGHCGRSQHGPRPLHQYKLPEGLKQLIGLKSSVQKPIRQAVIDVGTNSVKFHIGQLEPSGIWTTVVDRAEVTRLGEGLGETGLLSGPAMERTAATIAGMKDEATRIGV